MEENVHVWRIHAGSASAAAPSFLSRDETRFARRFHNPLHAQQWAFFRSALRDILATYCGVSAADIAFRHSAYGKPGLEEHAGLYFNQTHSKALSLLAVTELAPVGVDVEHTRHLDSMESMAELVFTRAECESLRERPPHRRQNAFYDLWTRKEAALKANGMGLSIAPRAVHLGFEFHAGWQCTTLGPENSSDMTYRICRLETAQAYAGALALETPQDCHITSTNIRYFDYAAARNSMHRNRRRTGPVAGASFR